MRRYISPEGTAEIPSFHRVMARSHLLLKRESKYECTIWGQSAVPSGLIAVAEPNPNWCWTVIGNPSGIKRSKSQWHWRPRPRESGACSHHADEASALLTPPAIH